MIIVIAIMAILIGVVALAVLPNIQRSRESKDIQALDSIASAANAAIATTQAKKAGTIVLGTCANGVGPGSGTTEQAKIWKSVYETVATGAGKTESDATDGCSIVLSYDVSSKTVEVAYMKTAPSASTAYTSLSGEQCKYLDQKFEVKNTGGTTT